MNPQDVIPERTGPLYTVSQATTELGRDGRPLVTVHFLEMPACIAQAETEEAAVARLWAGLPAWLEMIHSPCRGDSKQPC